MAGVPFERLEELATRDTSQLAREILARRTEVADARRAAERLLAKRDSARSEEDYRALRSSLRTARSPTTITALPAAFAQYFRAHANLLEAESRIESAIDRELNAARTALFQSGRNILPAYLVFSAEGLAGRLNLLLGRNSENIGSLPVRNARARERERLLHLYLQRVCAKDDTFSEFGPTAWGRSDRATDGVRLTAQPGIAAREAFLERWAAHGAIVAMNNDPAIRPELSPRIDPNGRIDGDSFIFTDTGEAAPIDSDVIRLLLQCNGGKPAYSLGAVGEQLEWLAARKMIRWEMEVPALEPHAFDVLVDDISRWREGLVRTHWMDLLKPIANLAVAFRNASNVATRIAIIADARRRLHDLGAAPGASQRFLYSAVNPIGEECFRECHFEVSEGMMDEVAQDAEPWIDLWRDTYAFVASRVAAGLRGLLETAPQNNGAVSLPAFLRHCETQKLPLTGHGIVALSVIAFQEVKTAFRKVVGDRPDAVEWELTREDCHFVRRTFDYAKFDEYTYPSADLQLSASSIEAAGRGDYQWIVAELHPPIALLHHCALWKCPDLPALSRAFASTTFGKPSFHYGFFAADFTAHTAVRVFDALPDQTHFVAPQRGNPAWRRTAPAEAEVYVDESGDVCVRRRDTHEHLGSFARAWVIPLGFHPFQFTIAPHTPRLRCGNVIVQRRTWVVAQSELESGDYAGISRTLIVAIEKLRGQKEWPRFIYIRPTERSLRRSGAEGRDKDTKPVFIDLESYLSLEIFYRWLMKAGELDVTEMLPDPDHLLWQESDGRRTFELRTQIVPRE